MSAFICNIYHLSVLVSYLNKKDVKVYLKGTGGAGLVYDTKDKDDAHALLMILQKENYRSVNKRYSESNEPPHTPFKFISDDYSPVQILKACSCYDYQACETDDYHKSDAAKIIEAIRLEAINDLDGYDNAQWEIRPPVERAIEIP